MGDVKFKLSDVVVIPKDNNCQDCKTRVETYIKNVQEWQSAYDALTKERDEMRVLLREAKMHSKNGSNPWHLDSWIKRVNEMLGE